MQNREELREQILGAVREERKRQIEMYGTNDGLEIEMGPSVKWLRPFSSGSAETISRSFRADYNDHRRENGEPTWMHLIREEVAEMFEASSPEDIATEAVQVAALCVSLVEHLSRYGGLNLKLSPENFSILIQAYDDGDGGNLDLTQRGDGWVVGTFGGHTVYEGIEIDGTLYSISYLSSGQFTVAVGDELKSVDGKWFDSAPEARAYIKGLTRR